MVNISIKNICYNIKNKKILSDITFSINKGEIILLLGKNGSGKSTLLKIISGIIRPTDGNIIVENVDLNNILNTKKEIYMRQNILSFVMQNSESQLLGSTVEDDIAFGLENKRYSRKKIDDIINYYLNIFNVEYIRYKETNMLSGGEKQICSIINSLVMDTNFYLFDEVTSQLDPQLKNKVLNYFLKIKRNKSILLTTHDINDIFYADRIIFLEESKIIFDGNKEDFIKNLNLINNYIDEYNILYFSLKLFEKNLISKMVSSYKELEEELCK